MQSDNTVRKLKIKQYSHLFYFILSAAILYAFPKQYLIFDALICFGSYVSIKELISLIKHPEDARYSTILYVAILGSATIGTFITMLMQGVIEVEHFQYFSLFGLYYKQAGMSHALAGNFLAVGLLYFVSVYDHKLNLEALKKLRDNPRAELILLMGSGLIFLALATGKLGFGGSVGNTAGVSGVSPLGSIAVLMLPGLIVLSFLVVYTTEYWKKRVIFGAILLILMIVLMMFHRRSLLYTMLICAMVWSLLRENKQNYPKFKLIAYSLLSVLVIYVGFMSFFAMRFSKNYFGRAMGISTQLKLATTILNSGGFALIQAGLQKNVSGRTLSLGYLGGIMSQPRNHLPMYGTETIYSVKQAIPSAFLSGKAGMAQGPEQISHPVAGIMVFDGPNSILTTGYDDFGILGMALYPSLLIVITNLILSLFYKHLFRSHYVYLFFTICMMYAFLCIGVEDALSNFIVEMRNLIIVGILITAIIKITYYFRLGNNRKVNI